MSKVFRAGNLVLLALSLGLIVVSLIHCVKLVAGPAPFRQPYYMATELQDIRVTHQLIWSLFGTPLGVFLLLVALPRKLITTRWTLGLGGATFILFYCLAKVAWLFLRYGFGSEYEHVNTEQALHLSIVCSWSHILLFAGIGIIVSSALLASGALDSREGPR